MEWLDNKEEAVWRGSRTKGFLFGEKEIFPKDGARREGQKEDARPACCIVPVEAGGVGCQSVNTRPSVTVTPAFLQGPWTGSLEAGACSPDSHVGGLMSFLVFIRPVVSLPEAFAGSLGTWKRQTVNEEAQLKWAEGIQRKGK